MNLFQKFVVSGFIVFQLLTMIRVHLPLGESKFFYSLYRPIDAYLSSFSLYQDWMMFAPNPSRTEVYVTAEVEFDNGVKDTFSFPKPWELSIAQKYVNGERIRKFISEGVRRDENSWMWPDTARFVLRQLKAKHFDKIPLKVHLYRHWYDTPDLRQVFHPQAETVKDYARYRFYTYEVL